MNTDINEGEIKERKRHDGKEGIVMGGGGT